MHYLKRKILTNDTSSDDDDDDDDDDDSSSDADEYELLSNDESHYNKIK